MASYNNSRPWANTVQNDLYLELLEIRPVPSEPDDFLYTIENQYKFRADLLAYDLYGNRKLWWVFMQRNMNVLKDPVFDFLPGTRIYIPKQNNLTKFLGV